MTQDISSDSEGWQLVSLECEITPQQSGMRLDKVAVQLLPDYSRSQITSWIRSGALQVNQSNVTPSSKVMGGQLITVFARLQEDENWYLPQAVPFDIIYEDEHLLVVDKPAGLVVHPGAGNRDHTLVNGLMAFNEQQGQLPRAGLIHRLDKDTSGLLLVARNSRSFKLLTTALKNREIKRRYHAVVEGVLTAGMSIDVSMGRDPKNRTRQKVQESGRPALTHVTVLDRYRAHTLVEAQLETGRTHQIRVHMSHMTYPLLGDTLYGARVRLPRDPHPDLPAVIQAFKRQALHACSLQFAHPASEEWLECSSPRPDDLAALIKKLEQDRDTYVD